MDYKIITDLSDAQPVFEKMQELAVKKMRLAERKQRLIDIGDHKTSQSIGTEISIVKTELAILRDSVEYVKIKCFIQVAKQYLTRQQFDEINEKVNEILLTPELYLIGTKNQTT